MDPVAVIATGLLVLMCVGVTVLGILLWLEWLEWRRGY